MGFDPGLEFVGDCLLGVHLLIGIQPLVCGGVVEMVRHNESDVSVPFDDRWAEVFIGWNY